ncbi:MAG TPA: heterodisulfide reductase-related iron-sulfur binding cluster [Burkholderiales bacterium]|nr:heterodisulfide reductase-related iron-sulfur binding cluster [Burkholderiales bacterium]
MGERVTFWYGCNVLRHGDIIHACLDILRAIGFEASPVGGPDYCCGTVKDANQTTAGGMATRTVGKLNDRGARVVAWCPSCHSHMHVFMDKAHDRHFDMSYMVELVHANRDKLAPLLKNRVPMRVMLHKHVGFNELVPVNRMVPEILSLIPGVEVVDAGYAAPGYMCASFAGMPAALQDMHTDTVRAAKALGAEALVTTFHQCFREMVGLEAAGVMPVHNYIQLIAQSMGLPYEDEYKAWKRAPDEAMAMIGPERIAKVGVEFYERAILPELKKRPTLSK